MFAQFVGTMSVDLLVEMFRTIPNFRYVKDEAGEPLERVGEIRKRTGEQLKVFSGKGVQTMITEMELGFCGHCPYTNLADVYAQPPTICSTKARSARPSTCSAACWPWAA